MSTSSNEKSIHLGLIRNFLKRNKLKRKESCLDYPYQQKNYLYIIFAQKLNPDMKQTIPLLLLLLWSLLPSCNKKETEKKAAESTKELMPLASGYQWNYEQVNLTRGGDTMDCHGR